MEAARIYKDDVILTLSFTKDETALLQKFIERLLKGTNLLKSFPDFNINDLVKTGGMLRTIERELRKNT